MYVAGYITGILIALFVIPLVILRIASSAGTTGRAVRNTVVKAANGQQAADELIHDHAMKPRGNMWRSPSAHKRHEEERIATEQERWDALQDK